MQRLPGRSTLGWLAAVTAAGITVNGLRLRRRAAALATLVPTQRPVDPEHRFLVASGVRLDDDTARAASAFASDNDLSVLDLVPADLPFDNALDLLRGVDPAAYRDGRFAAGRGACHAVLAHTDVLQRAGIAVHDDLDPAELARITVQLKLFAADSTDLAVAPGLRARADDTATRLALRAAAAAQAGTDALLVAGPPVVHAALAAATVAAQPAAAAGVAALAAQPALVFAGSPLRPRDLTAASMVARAWRRPRDWLRAQQATPPAEKPEQDPQVRARYAADLTDGLARFSQERSATCPWCGSAELTSRVVSPDHLQGKPGNFTLDRCDSCGHTFQNPRLNDAGLEFYYRDFYDGLGAGPMQLAFAFGGTSYRDRARFVARHTQPATWLDVGTGLGSFGLAAQEVLPHTHFDGLDRSDNVVEGQRRGWLRRGIQASFTDVADEISGRYDVVSMHHYLEHTTEPLAELDAAAKILKAGGYLSIEVPDPESRFADALGQWWMPWLQPQHLHMIPAGNLVAALADRGLTTVEVQRAPANQSGDLAMAVLLAFLRFARDPNLPWLPERDDPTHIPRLLVGGAVAAPLGAAAFTADKAFDWYLRRTDGVGNAYRVLARKDA
ncbi:class I SAM-dependent methyltransferase [Skermania sp. ID1734]|uniref:class I SAM-dependent methyltransferase n=1 Tax=Skermania sp. ID1734 TaxID=2597516 RepID=UPI001181186B|nr:class I SAM-dependent methyltransferase [Skermania sp. ID1734]TSE01111.1 class I SAM-dependent methyltransferase [Skermania sp. ID1734]